MCVLGEAQIAWYFSAYMQLSCRRYMSKGVPKCKIACKIITTATLSSEICFWLNVRTVNDITSSMERSSSWGANSFSPCKEINCILWNPKVRHRCKKSPPLYIILNQNNRVQAFQYITLGFILILSSHLA